MIRHFTCSIFSLIALFAALPAGPQRYGARPIQCSLHDRLRACPFAKAPGRAIRCKYALVVPPRLRAFRSYRSRAAHCKVYCSSIGSSVLVPPIICELFPNAGSTVVSVPICVSGAAGKPGPLPGSLRRRGTIFRGGLAGEGTPCRRSAHLKMTLVNRHTDQRIEENAVAHPDAEAAIYIALDVGRGAEDVAVGGHVVGV